MRRTLTDILGMIKFSHTLFALPFAVFGGLLAAHSNQGWIGRPRDALGILLCMAFARSAAMAFNRLADREIDARNPRTAERHLPAKRLSVGSVMVFTAISALLFVLSTLIFLPNRWPFFLAVPVLLWICGYSYAKRFTNYAQVWLGSALMLAPVAAWIAIRGDIQWPPVLLGLAVLLWVTGFDTIYACQDIEFDRKQGLRSIPARFGIEGALRIALACHALMVLVLIVLGIVTPLGWVYQTGVGVIAVLLVYEHRLVRPNDLSRVNLAFFQMNIIISLGLLAFGTVDLLLASRSTLP